MIVGVLWICMPALDDQRLLSTTREIYRDLIMFSIEEADIVLVAGVGHSQVRAYPPASAQLGHEPLGRREEDLLSKLDDLF